MWSRLPELMGQSVGQWPSYGPHAVGVAGLDGDQVNADADDGRRSRDGGVHMATRRDAVEDFS